MARRRKKISGTRRALWMVAPLLLWTVFSWWYTNTGGPLTPQEIDSFIATLEARGSDPEQRELLREFLSSDTGDDFVMLNLIELNTGPSAQDPHLEAREALDRYMAHMWPALLSRACHPVNFGTAASNALDLWGLDGAKKWTQGAMMRYRSRRDLVELSSDPDFQGPHDQKVAAMSKTIAVPLDPWTNSGDPRLLLGLVALLVTLFGWRR